MKRIVTYIVAWLLTCGSLFAISIEIDYTYDTGNFFKTPEKRNAMEAVARFFEEVLADELLEIDASKFPGASWTATFTHPTTVNQGVFRIWWCLRTR